jgi:hypothetical protein
MDSQTLLIDNNRDRVLNELLNFLGLDNMYAVIITGSTSQKTASSKSDLDVRMIVKDFVQTCDNFKRFLVDKKLILLEDKNPFAELKFFIETIPFHVLFYTVEHVENSLKNKNFGFISTITKGNFIYKQSSSIDPIIDKCNEIINELKNSNEYLVGAKSQFVKAMSRYEHKNYSEAMYCLRIASTYLIKDYLIKKGFIDIKEQWILRDIENADNSENKIFMKSFMEIHQLNNIQVEQVKKTITLVSTLINKMGNTTNV